MMSAMIEPLDPAAAAGLVRNWGFVSHTDLPDRAGHAWLTIAIRPQPTLEHFDPERVEYWATSAGRGVARTIDHATQLPLDTEFSWGRVQVADRLNVVNEWVSFGGHLMAAEVDGAIICVFQSEAPILRRGGHSQGWDHGAANLAAFFGRIKVAVDYLPGFEGRVATAAPRVRFGAFIADLVTRYRAAPALVDMHPDLWQLIRGAESELRTSEPHVWEEGLALAAGAGLVELPERRTAV